MRTLITIPVYNEEKYVERVLTRVLSHAEHVLVIDDGSTDRTPCRLPEFPVEVIRHAENRGYGRSLMDAFRWAVLDNYDWVITMDCDEQHEPESIPDFVAAAAMDDADVVSGSRYLARGENADIPPENRRAINARITRILNERLGLCITDAFCGFKAYRVSALQRLSFDVRGYAFPMQFWVQAVAAGLRIKEIPVSLIYNDPNRTFGGPLNDDEVRLRHYLDVFEREMDRCAERIADRVASGTGGAATCSACCSGE
jgi:dolichol-phosphate mannosyltransferase